MFLVKYRVIYKSGHRNTRTKLVSEPNKTQAFAAIKRYEYENFEVSDIEALQIIPHTPQK